MDPNIFIREERLMSFSFSKQSRFRKIVLILEFPVQTPYRTQKNLCLLWGEGFRGGRVPKEVNTADLGLFVQLMDLLAHGLRFLSSISGAFK